MTIVDSIKIAKDFSVSLGSRYITDGDFSGEQFLNDILLDKFKNALEKEGILFIDLDGVYGYPSSFVSGSFGKLSLDYGAEVVRKHLEFKSDDNSLRLERILKEIKSPKKVDTV